MKRSEEITLLLALAVSIATVVNTFISLMEYDLEKITAAPLYVFYG